MTRLWAAVASAADVDASARADIARRIERWIDDGGVGVALVTCHRAEVYGVGPSIAVEGSAVLSGEEAVRHLFRVACGLESVIVGEDEVLHQVREALRLAHRHNPDARLRRLFESAIAVGRAARAGRTRSSGNLAHRAVEWLGDKADIKGGRVVVAGAGRMGAALAHAARAAGAHVVIASRDAARADRLAKVYDGEGVDLRAGARLAGDAAGVGVALAGPWLELLGVDGRRLPPVADISAPSALPADVRSGLNGTFLGIDELFAMRVLDVPGPYSTDAQRLIERKTSELTTWLGLVS